MNALVRMRNSHARRFEPGSKLAHATIARINVSWTRSFAVSGSRQIRIATPYSSAWWGKQAIANGACGSLLVVIDPGVDPSGARTVRGAWSWRRTMREAAGTVA